MSFLLKERRPFTVNQLRRVGHHWGSMAPYTRGHAVRRNQERNGWFGMIAESVSGTLLDWVKCIVLVGVAGALVLWVDHLEEFGFRKQSFRRKFK